MKSIATPLAAFLEADKKRTQGLWECGNHPARPDLGVVKPIMLGNRVGKFPECDGSAAYFCHYPDAEFIAAASQLPLTEILAGYNAMREELVNQRAFIQRQIDNGNRNGIGSWQYERRVSEMDRVLSTTEDLSKLRE